MDSGATADVFFYRSPQALGDDRQLFSDFIDQGYTLLTYHSLAVVYPPVEFTGIPIEETFSTVLGTGS